MLRIIPFLFLVLCGPVLGGPQTNFHGNMTDQELFWGTDQYDFSVVVPAAGLECFWHFAHRGERFYLSFMNYLFSKSVLGEGQITKAPYLSSLSAILWSSD
ncbi:hypothetical protein KUCAC02_016950 [Chaenocephalus aceratus]|nr:hypothetical protein KUCAC02_016950 [Chaenocephalus aceratus]